MGWRSRLRALTPAPVRPLLRPLDPAARRRDRRLAVLDGLVSGPPGLAFYDGDLNVLRLVARPGELEWVMRNGVIADAALWLPKVAHLIASGDTVFDVGGGVGVTAQYFAERARVVHVFEPTPASVRLIEQGLKLRGLSNVQVHAVAASDRAGTAEFNLLAVATHNSLGRVDTSPFLKTIAVPTIRLDDFAAERGISRIDFMKIDVEGFEHEVLMGAEGLLASGRVRRIFFEVNRRLLASIGRTAAPVHDILVRNGYALTDADGDPLDLAAMLEGRVTDALATRG